MVWNAQGDGGKEDKYKKRNYREKKKKYGFSLPMIITVTPGPWRTLVAGPFCSIVVCSHLFSSCSNFFFFFFKLIIYLFMAVLGLCFCARAFSSCGKRGPLFIAVRGPLTIAASPVAEHRLQTRRLSSCGSRAQLLRGMWDLPRPGLEPASPALAGRLSTTAPPGKPHVLTSNMSF